MVLSTRKNGSLPISPRPFIISWPNRQLKAHAQIFSMADGLKEVFFGHEKC